MYTPIVTFESKSELDNSLKESKEQDKAILIKVSMVKKLKEKNRKTLKKILFLFKIKEEVDHQVLKIRKNIKYFIKL